MLPNNTAGIFERPVFKASIMMCITTKEIPLKMIFGDFQDREVDFWDINDEWKVQGCSWVKETMRQRLRRVLKMRVEWKIAMSKVDSQWVEKIKSDLYICKAWHLGPIMEIRKVDFALILSHEPVSAWIYHIVPATCDPYSCTSWVPRPTKCRYLS